MTLLGGVRDGVCVACSLGHRLRWTGPRTLRVLRLSAGPEVRLRGCMCAYEHVHLKKSDTNDTFTPVGDCRT